MKGLPSRVWVMSQASDPVRVWTGSDGISAGTLRARMKGLLTQGGPGFRNRMRPTEASRMRLELEAPHPRPEGQGEGRHPQSQCAREPHFQNCEGMLEMPAALSSSLRQPPGDPLID